MSAKGGYWAILFLQQGVLTDLALAATAIGGAGLQSCAGMRDSDRRVCSAAVYLQTARAADMGAHKHWSQAQAICYMFAHRQASQNLPTCAVQLRLKPDLHPMQCKLLTHLTDTEADNYQIAAAHTIGLCPGLAGPLQRSATVILCFALPTAVPKTQRTK